MQAARQYEYVVLQMSQLTGSSPLMLVNVSAGPGWAGALCIWEHLVLLLATAASGPAGITPVHI